MDKVNAEPVSFGYVDLFKAGRTGKSVTLFSLVALFALDSLVVNTSLPTILRELGNVELYGWAIAAYSLGNLITAPLFSVSTGKIGIRLSLFAASMLFILGASLSSLAADMILIVLGRFIQGLGAGGFAAITFRIISRFYPPDLQTRAVGFGSAIWGFAAIGGPLLGAAILKAAGWRWVFGYNVPAGAAILALALWMLRDEGPPVSPEASMNIVGPSLFAFATTLLLESLYQKTPWDFILSGGAILLFMGFLLHERKHKNPIIPGDALNIFKPLGVAFLGTVLITTTFVGPESYLPLIIQGIWDTSALDAGFILTIGSIGWALASLAVPVFSGHPRRLILGGGLTILLSLLVLTFLIRLQTAIYFIYPAWFLVGFGYGLVFPMFNTMVLDHEKEYSEGVATGTFVIASLWGSVIGPPLLGVFAQIGFEKGFAPRMIGLHKLDGRSLHALCSGAVDSLVCSLALAFILIFVSLRAPAKRNINS